ncbi:MAG: hypothetical protein JKY46_01630 [Robiginitomaculum sp.]|nr:hypothetical protein [Robiginitomaculum sp.]
MQRNEWFKAKWIYMRRSFLSALLGVALLVLSAVLKIDILVVGILLFVPLLGGLVVIPLLHWKDRYIGEKSTLWGVVLLIETSGWGKLIYWFRHLLPDWKRSGQYENLE